MMKPDKIESHFPHSPRDEPGFGCGWKGSISDQVCSKKANRGTVDGKMTALIYGNEVLVG
jgi:hypothetical protein